MKTFAKGKCSLFPKKNFKKIKNFLSHNHAICKHYFKKFLGNIKKKFDTFANSSYNDIDNSEQHKNKTTQAPDKVPQVAKGKLNIGIMVPKCLNLSNANKTQRGDADTDG